MAHTYLCPGPSCYSPRPPPLNDNLRRRPLWPAVIPDGAHTVLHRGQRQAPSRPAPCSAALFRGPHRSGSRSTLFSATATTTWRTNAALLRGELRSSTRPTSLYTALHRGQRRFASYPRRSSPRPTPRFAGALLCIAANAVPRPINATPDTPTCKSS